MAAHSSSLLSGGREVFPHRTRSKDLLSEIPAHASVCDASVRQPCLRLRWAGRGLGFEKRDGFGAQRIQCLGGFEIGAEHEKSEPCRATSENLVP